jgi:hypothetical protein
VKVLLVEPEYRKLSAEAKRRADEKSGSSYKKRDDEVLWYPPLGLLKLATFHKRRGDEVKFVSGCDKSLFEGPNLFSPGILWDRVYISTLFTFEFKKTIETITFYKDAVGGSVHKIFVGGIMASLMPSEIIQETNVQPIRGVLCSPQQLGLEGNVNIDLLPPAYDILDNRLYAINDTYYAYTTRGCTNKCGYCGVTTIEPSFVEYIDIKDTIRELRAIYGDKPKLKLMDNNVLASQRLEQIVDDLGQLGYGRNHFTDTNPKKQRVIDFNQGLDASCINANTMLLLSRLNIRPMRIAFDNVKEKAVYERALEMAKEGGLREFSNYMLYNWNDTPKDLYERLKINIKLNQKWGNGSKRSSAAIYSYPMRYAPIRSVQSGENQKRDYVSRSVKNNNNFITSAVWNKRFTRNIEIMKGAAFGAISPTPELARRTIGKSYKEFIANLYMPEELLRNRNKHEKRLYRHEPKRAPGTGKVEKFRKFILRLLERRTQKAAEFHNAVSQNSAKAIRDYLCKCKRKEVQEWLKLYMKK